MCIKILNDPTTSKQACQANVSLTAELEAGASNGGTEAASIDLGDSEEGLEDTTKTFTSEETRGDGEHVHVVGAGVALHPDVVEDGAGTHGNGVVGLGHDEGETDGVPVGDPDPVLAWDPEVLHDDGEGGEDGEGDGGVAG